MEIKIKKGGWHGRDCYRPVGKLASVIAAIVNVNSFSPSMIERARKAGVTVTLVEEKGAGREDQKDKKDQKEE
ncbi:MAG: hypothetical protein ABSA33_01840 [Candidatus Micrarchaeaceae archaeon]